MFHTTVYSVIRIEPDAEQGKVWYTLATKGSIERLPGFFVEANFRLIDAMDRLLYE